MTHSSHKKGAPKKLRLVIISVSSTRTPADDKSGQWMSKKAKKEGHTVLTRKVIPDDLEIIAQSVMDEIESQQPDAILITGGTGISKQDVTIEAVRPMFTKELTAFNALFAQLSFEKIDSAALMSRATAGIVEKTVIFCMPGSLRACRLACKALIFPELGHILKHIKE
jgi:molybdenum cofactor biosynthesis protein B